MDTGDSAAAAAAAGGASAAAAAAGKRAHAMMVWLFRINSIEPYSSGIPNMLSTPAILIIITVHVRLCHSDLTADLQSRHPLVLMTVPVSA